jgi:hypothetical protein
VYFYRYLSDVRGPAHPLTVGQRVRLPGMTAQVQRMDRRGFPVEVAFKFDVPLEDASLRWLWWDWDRDIYASFEVPALGETARLVGPF